MSAPWFRSKALRITAIVVAVLLVALLVAPYLFDLNRYRSVIVSQLGQATGREVELGSIRLHFLPSLHVVVNDLHIKNPGGFPAGDTASVEDVSVGLAFFPLLSGTVQITGVAVENAVLNLLENERGENNYESLLQASTKAKRPVEAGLAAGAGGASLDSIDSVSIQGARITSGTFWRREKKIYPQGEITGINASASGFDFKDPHWMTKLRADMDLGSIEISSPALKEPLRFTDGAISVRDNKAEGKFELALGSIRAKGNLNVPNLERGEAARFSLAANELDVNAVGALVAGGQAAGRGPRRSGDPNKLLARGDVSVARLVAPPVMAQNVKASARLYATRLELDPFNLSLYGGKAQGTLATDLAGEDMMTRVNAKLTSVNVGQLLAAVNPKGTKSITGTLEADARLATSLASRDPMAALGGGGTFAVRNGTFPGLDVQGTLAQMAKLFQMDVPTGDTKFTYFGGDFRFAGQRIHSNQLRLDAEALDASVGGSVGFDQTLNYNGTGLLKGQGTAQPQPEQRSNNPLGGFGKVFGRVMQETMKVSGMRIPFGIRGTLQDIKIVPGGAPQPIPR